MEENERTPFQITQAAKTYDAIQRLPVAVILENLRSLHNVGAFFRTADAVRADVLVLCGFTGAPPRKEITKTALGAESVVRWEQFDCSTEAVQTYRRRGFQIASVETGMHAIDLFDWQPDFPVCLLFGNELNGLSPEISAEADLHVQLPMLGMKHSLNVATAGGIVLYELLRKYRLRVEQAQKLNSGEWPPQPNP